MTHKIEGNGPKEPIGTVLEFQPCGWSSWGKIVALWALFVGCGVFVEVVASQSRAQTARIEAQLTRIADNLTTQTAVMTNGEPLTMRVLPETPLPPPPSLEEFNETKKGRKK